MRLLTAGSYTTLGKRLNQAEMREAFVVMQNQFAPFTGEAVECREALTGAYDDEVPPVPIPNTVVKLIRAEDTWRVTAWENRSVPV